MARTGRKKHRSDFLSNLLFMLWTLFITKWPDILTNLISDFIYDVFKIDLKDFVLFLIFLFIVASLILGLYQNAKRFRKAHPRKVKEQGMYEKQILMQGSMFSLSALLSYLCLDFCNGTSSSILALPFSSPLFALLAAIAPIIGSGIAHQSLKDEVTQLARLSDNVSKYIDDKLRREQRVDQRMIVNFVQGNKEILPDDVEDWVRLQLFFYYEQERYKQVTDVFISLDTLREPENWKLVKGRIRPAT